MYKPLFATSQHPGGDKSKGLGVKLREGYAVFCKNHQKFDSIHSHEAKIIKKESKIEEGPKMVFIENAESGSYAQPIKLHLCLLSIV